MSDTDFVAAIIAQLKKPGPLRERRSDPDHRAIMPLQAYVECEVRQSIARLARKQPLLPPTLPDAAKPPTLPDFHQAGRIARDLAARLRKVALFDDQRALIPKLEHISRELLRVSQFPPARANMLAYWGASEAFDLLKYAAKAPTGYAVRQIASHLVEAATGKACSVATLKHACDHVLRDRRRYDAQAFERP